MKYQNSLAKEKNSNYWTFSNICHVFSHKNLKILLEVILFLVAIFTHIGFLSPPF